MSHFFVVDFTGFVDEPRVPRLPVPRPPVATLVPTPLVPRSSAPVFSFEVGVLVGCGLGSPAKAASETAQKARTKSGNQCCSVD